MHSTRNGIFLRRGLEKDNKGHRNDSVLGFSCQRGWHQGKQVPSSQMDEQLWMYDKVRKVEAEEKSKKENSLGHYVYLWYTYTGTCILKPKKYYHMSLGTSIDSEILARKYSLASLFFASCSLPHRLKCLSK